MFEIYAYGNVDTLTGVFNAIAAIMGGDDYFGLVKTVAVTGVLVAAFAGLFTPGRFHGWSWLIGFMLLYYGLFLPRADVVIVDKLGSQSPVVVGNVPIGVAFFGHYTSKVGDVMTRFFETAFQVIPAPNAQLPSELAYQKNGVLFGNRLIQASRRANVADPQLRTDLIAYVYNCTLYDLQDGTIDPAAFSQSTDIWALMGTPNPARFTTYGNPVQVDTCPNVYTYVASRLPAEVARARAMLAFQLNPSLDPTAAQGVIDSQIEQAYYKTKIATAAQGASDLLRQNIMINLMQDTSSIVGQKINDPASIMIATARANATASINSSFLTMGKVAEQALPLVRNVIEAIIYAVFPFVFLLFLLAQGRGLGLAVKSFVLSLVWIQLWPPLYAILNYVATLASAKNLESAARMGASTQGPGSRNRIEHLPRRHLRPGRGGLHGDLDPDHRHCHHQGRRSRLPGSHRCRADAVGRIGRVERDEQGQRQPELGRHRPAATRAEPNLRLHVHDEQCPRQHHSGQRARCRRFPLPGHLESAGHDLHLQRAPGNIPFRKRPRIGNPCQDRT
jgi:conjugal transfer mating pair stabilization protein TraG